MTYESDLREIYQRFKRWFANNLEPTEQEIINWLKYSYIKGRQAMGDDDFVEDT